VARSADGSQIRPDLLLDEPATLYLIGDAKASKLLRPIFLALLGEIVDRAYERATLAGGTLEKPLLLCLDEAGNVAPLPNLAEIASTAPSHNIQLVSIFHDLSQARSRYGGQAETVINSHRARLLLPGVADLETLRYFAGLLGEEEIREITRTTGASGTTRSSGSRRRPLVAPEALRQLPADQALLVYGRLAPTQLRLRLWFQDRRLRRLARVGTQ
jgi:type IV secretory pathway TraG/TraD family ATPase VirD4